MDGLICGTSRGYGRKGSVVRLAMVIGLLAAVIAPWGGWSTARAADSKPTTRPEVKKKVTPLQWYTAYPQALVESRKNNKRMILAYFCGTDWDEWTKKLDAEVLTTDMFREWAEKNVILLKIDFPKTKPLSGMLADQNERLRNKYNLLMVPSLLFLDSDGLLVARCGYTTASLRETEEKGNCAAWIKYADEIVKNPPPPEVLAEIKSFPDALLASHKKFIPLIIMLTKNPSAIDLKRKTDLLAAQPFIRFANHNMLFTEQLWPDEIDKSANAEALRKFIADNKVGPASFQLLVWDEYGRNDIKLRERIFAIPTDMDILIDRLDKQVPTPDYAGQWLEDYKMAQFTATRLKRPLLICFTSLDSSEYCQKFEEEIFKTDEFKKYARKNLVLMRADFPKSGKQDQALKEQNSMLANLFSVRGYPLVVIFNPLGQRIGDSKYMKGGPEPFIKQMDAVVRSDRFSRP